MKLGELVLENKRIGATQKNEQLIRIRLKELAYAYPDEVTEVLIKTGVQLRSKLPSSVLYAILIKNAPTNALLSDALAKMILEMDSYLQADGGKAWVGILGSTLSAVGSVISGIGRGQNENSADQLALQKMQYEQEKKDKEEQAARVKRGWIIFGISVALITALIIAIRIIRKKNAGKSPQPLI